MGPRSESVNPAAAWRKFVSTSQIVPGTIRADIAESWRRCRRAQLDPLDGLTRRTLGSLEFKQLLEKKSDLLTVARPFVGRLYRIVENTGFMVMLADEEGNILDVLGDRGVLEKASEINLDKGFPWLEAEAGTNGIGTALALGSSVQVSGAEHYCGRVQQWTCSAAPIYSSGRLVGVLQMSGPHTEANKHTLGMVVAAVEAIGDLLSLSRSQRDDVLIENALKGIWRQVDDGIILVDRLGRIDQLNPAAERIFQRKELELKGRMLEDFLDRTKEITDVLEHGSYYDRQGLILNTDAGRVHCVSDGKPLRGARGEIAGAVVFLNPLGKGSLSSRRGGRAEARFGFEDIIGEDPAFLEIMRMALHAADNQSNVLLQGESGTGKDVFAQAIHNGGARRNGPFIAVNCGALPRDLIVSELFGYADGAFTGAARGGSPGKFELASGGTLFLDEIGELPLDQQVVLLRVLQEKRITRIGGGSRVIPVDVRIICASNKDLRTEALSGAFRMDLYYRLNVIPLHLPPLRERRGDIPLFLEAFLREICERSHMDPPSVDPRVVDLLSEYDWPGNIRELQNALERMIVAAEDKGRISVSDIPEEILGAKGPMVLDTIPAPRDQADIKKGDIKTWLADMDRREILSAMAEVRGNISRAAKILGISRATLYRRMKRLRMDI